MPVNPDLGRQRWENVIDGPSFIYWAMASPSLCMPPSVRSATSSAVLPYPPGPAC
jgi:hypothetical protein